MPDQIENLRAAIDAALSARARAVRANIDAAACGTAADWRAAHAAEAAEAAALDGLDAALAAVARAIRGNRAAD